MPEPSLVRRIWLQLGHHASWITIAVYSFFVAEVVPGIPAPSGRGIDFAILGVLVLLAAAAWWHNIHLCLACAADIPDDPEKELKRHRGKLHHFHVLIGKTRRGVIARFIGLAVVLLGSLAMPSVLFNTIVDTTATLLVAYFALCTIYHHRLQFWCPWCRPGGGGGGDNQPKPAPGPTDYTKR